MMCRHVQAEPVVLSTGETVACVCIWCFEPLPADYIARQAALCEREAYCAHGTLISVNAEGMTSWEFCADCQTNKDEFVAELLMAMTKPIDERAFSAIVPIILRDIP